jgi:hypothetical protein
MVDRSSFGMHIYVYEEAISLGFHFFVTWGPTTKLAGILIFKIIVATHKTFSFELKIRF